MKRNAETTRLVEWPGTAILFSILPVLVACSTAYSQGVAIFHAEIQSVVIYENPDFGGRSKTLVVGNTHW